MHVLGNTTSFLPYRFKNRKMSFKLRNFSNRERIYFVEKHLLHELRNSWFELINDDFQVTNEYLNLFLFII
jgi:hypothetical protein